MFKDSSIYQKTLADAVPECAAELLAGKTVLVTGSTGLIGTVLVDALMRGGFCGKVIAGARSRENAVKRFGEYKGDARFSIAQYDLFKPFHMLEKCHYIVHLAANANPTAYKTNPVGTLTGLVGGADMLLDYCAKRKSARFMCVSSNEVYGKCAQSPVTEDDIGALETLDSRSCYPMGKRAAETLCACYEKEYGVDYVIARVCHTYGPTVSEADDRAASQFLKDAAAGKDIVLQSDGSAERSYIYVADCVNGILTAMLKGEKGQAYNVAGKPATLLNLAEEIASKAGVSVTAGDEPSPAAGNIASTAKLEKLGWNAKYDLSKGVEATLGVMADR